MKRCKKCNYVMSDGNNYCSNCGSNDFEIIYTQENSMDSGAYEYSEYQIDSEAAKIRKKKMLSMLGVLVIIFLALIAFAAVKMSLDSKAQKESQAENQTQQEEISFSYGDINGNMYRNKWADMQFAFDDNWKQAPKDSYNYFEDKKAVCDFNAVSADNKSQITVFLIDLSNQDSRLTLSEADLLKEYSAEVSKKIDGAKVSEYQYQLIGNSLFVYTDASGQINGNDICVTTYLRRKDDYAILINISSVNAERNQKLSEKFEPCE